MNCAIYMSKPFSTRWHAVIRVFVLIYRSPQVYTYTVHEAQTTII